jgi:Ras GTPase-activating protein 1
MSLQESYMEVVNPFILKNKERMIVFLDQLSSVADPFVPSGMDIVAVLNNSSNNNSDPGRSTLILLIFHK